MAKVGIGIGGAVTSWANNDGGVGELNIAAAETAETAWTLRYFADEIDATAFGLTASSRAALAGLKQWDGSITMQQATPSVGVAAALDWDQLSETLEPHVRDWQLVVTAPPVDTTSFSTTGHKSFVPGVISWAATVNYFLDSAVAQPAIGGSGTLTLTLSSGNTLAGTGYLLSWNQSVSPAGRLIATVQVLGSGPIAATDGGANFFGGTASNLVRDADPEGNSSELVLTSSTSRTYTGDAFWTQVAINCPVDQKISATVNFQGTGDLTLG